MLHNLAVNHIEAASVVLFGIGFTMLLLHQNLIKKIIGLNIMDTAVYLFLAAKGYIEGRLPPIIVDSVPCRQRLYRRTAAADHCGRDNRYGSVY